MNSSPKFTVFTPTYNRAHLIHRVYDSLAQQTYINFEWIVIDDGSNDHTEDVLREFKQQSIFPIIYIKKENSGKVAAINDALDIAKGEWFVVFDSDDWCDAVALEKIYQEIKKLPSEDYAAISVLKRDTSGLIVGDDYKNIDKYDKTYMDRAVLGVKGDKWEIIKTDIHRYYRYELQGADKYMAPSFSWLLLAQKYKTVFVNEALSTIEYQDDGISKNNIKHRVLNCESTIFYYKKIHEISNDFKFKKRLKVNEMRFRLHKNFYFSLSFTYIFALGLYLIDKFKLRG